MAGRVRRRILCAALNIVFLQLLFAEIPWRRCGGASLWFHARIRPLLLEPKVQSRGERCSSLCGASCTIQALSNVSHNHTTAWPRPPQTVAIAYIGYYVSKYPPLPVAQLKHCPGRRNCSQDQWSLGHCMRRTPGQVPWSSHPEGFQAAGRFLDSSGAFTEFGAVYPRRNRVGSCHYQGRARTLLCRPRLGLPFAALLAAAYDPLVSICHGVPNHKEDWSENELEGNALSGIRGPPRSSRNCVGHFLGQRGSRGLGRRVR